MKRLFFSLLLLLSLTVQLNAKIIIGLTESKAPYLIEDFVVFDGVTYKFSLGTCELDFTANTPTSITIIGGSFEAVRYNDELATDVVLLSSIPRDKAGITSSVLSVKYPEELEDSPFPVTKYAEKLFSEKDRLTSLVFSEGITEIPDDFCYKSEHLNSVSFPESLETIGGWAFADCSNITSITLPHNIKNIYLVAFSGCNLTSIKIPSKISHIGINAFQCGSLESIVVADDNPYYDSRNNCNAIIETSTSTLIRGCKNTIIPDNMRRIEGSAFSYCDLKSIEIPTTVKEIGSHAFCHCEELSHIKIPDGVTAIEKYTFYYCEKLEAVEIPNSVISIGDFAFDSCRSLTSVTISNSVTSIGENAFCSCRGLTSINIPDGVTSIGGHAFSYCTGLTSINIPDDVTSIGGHAFSYCTGLTSIVVESGNTVYDSRNNCNAIIETSSNTLIVGCNNTIIPNSVTSIGENAFYGRDGLTSIIIPNSVTTIGVCAFVGCRKLISVTIPNSVTDIGGIAFYDCRQLKDFFIYADNLPKLGEDVFLYSNITNATLHVPASALEAYKNAEQWNRFGNIVAIEDQEVCYLKFRIISDDEVEVVALEDGKYEGDIVIPEIVELNGCFYRVTGIGDNAFNLAKEVTSVIIPESVLRIGTSAFRFCERLTTITIPDNVNSIGSNAFACCSNLKSITLPSSLTTIPDRMCYTNSQLSEINIPECVDSIGSMAFNRCEHLTKVILPDSLKSLKGGQFSDCSGLETITLGKNMNLIDNDVFTGCPNIDTVIFRQPNIHSPQSSWLKDNDGLKNAKHLVLGEGVKYIIGAFTACNSLESFYLSSTVEHVYQSFTGCQNVKSIIVDPANPYYDSRESCNAIIATANDSLIVGAFTTIIPNGVKHIGGRAFYDCIRLEQIDIPKGVSSIGGYAFYKSSISDLYIPASVDTIETFALASHNLKRIEVDAENLRYDSRENCNAIIYSSEDKLMFASSATDIPHSVKAIGEFAFAHIRGITTLIVPANVQNIGTAALASEDIERIYSFIESPMPITGYNVFFYRDVKLYVPRGTIDLYQSTDGWKRFSVIEEFDTDAIRHTSCKQINDAIIYDLSGQRLSKPQRGVNIIDGKKVVVK